MFFCIENTNFVGGEHNCTILLLRNKNNRNLPGIDCNMYIIPKQESINKIEAIVAKTYSSLYFHRVTIPQNFVIK